LEYISHVPSPTYQYARYTDWIVQFCEEKAFSQSKDSERYKDAIEQVR